MAEKADLSELTMGVAGVVAETVRSFPDFLEPVASPDPPPDLDRMQADALEAATLLARLARVSAEAVHARQDEPGSADLVELLPLLHGFAESYLLLGLASSWEELREQPVISPGLIEQLITDRAAELLLAAMDNDLGRSGTTPGGGADAAGS